MLNDPGSAGSALRNSAPIVVEFRMTTGARYDEAARALAEGRYFEALAFAKALVDEGDSHAYTLLGGASEKLGETDSSRYVDALAFYQKGAEQAAAVEAWLGIARLTYFGRGTARDFHRALLIYRDLADDDDNPVAHLVLGKMYLDGEGLEVDHGLAQHHLELARKAGYVFAYAYLGTLSFRKGRSLQGLLYRIVGGVLATWKTVHPQSRLRLRQI